MTTVPIELHDRVYDVDLTQLTPRARAFAEAVTRCTGHRPIAVVFETGRLLRERSDFAYRYGTHPDADAIGARPERQTLTDWLPARRGATWLGPIQWLEAAIRTIPVHGYPIAAAPFPHSDAMEIERVPSADAGAADRALVPSTVLEYLRTELGCPLSPQEWDELRQTRRQPAPDRYVCDVPQWRPETLHAFARARATA
ncbi:hypothetical protein [Streptomyces sp. NPDC018045]|uniref:hypothetical protein n=1 Tax=Streptomyces sp. NPDC018045 TaxID=3365037 RepID=UPI00379D6B70